MKLSELSDSSRMKLFWLICIPSRIGISLLTALAFPSAGDAVRYIFGIIYLIPPLWWCVYIFGLRTRSTGFFGGKAFWENARPVHTVLWIAASILTFIGTKETFQWAGGAFGADVLVAIALWLVNYDVSYKKPDLPV